MKHYSRKVIPFIEPDYFHDSSERVLFEEIAQYMVKYNARPSKEALGIEVEARNNLLKLMSKTSVPFSVI